MAERRLPYVALWLAFLLCLFVGGGLLLGSSARMQAIGLALILAPIGVFGALLAIYFLKGRWDAGRSGQERRPPQP